MPIGVVGAGRRGPGGSGLAGGEGRHRHHQSLHPDTGFAPFDVGRLADGAVMEAPRRPGAVYGEEFSEAGARRFFDGRSAG